MYYTRLGAANRRTGKALVGTFLVVFTLLLFSSISFGQTPAVPDEMRTVFMIGDIDNALGIYPLLVYIVNNDELILAEEFSAWEEGIGPVGLAVDEVHERLFVSYESHDGIDVYNARNMNLVDEITLSGTSDLSGIEVHNASNRLLVIDRWLPTLYEFDTVTFSLLDSWDLEGCDFPLAIDTAGDTLYATCGVYVPGTTPYYAPGNDVCYYDLNNQSLIDCITMSIQVAGLAVTDYPETTIYATGYTGHDSLTQYYMNSGVETSVDLEDRGKGVTLNPALGYVYAVKGNGGPFSSFAERGAIKVFEADTLTELHTYRYDPGFDKPSPTDAVASTIPFGGSVSKELTSHPSGIIEEGDNVVFTVTIENRHTKRITKCPLRDTYDTSHLTYSHSVPASDDNNDDGQIDFADIVAQLGVMWPGDTKTVELHFVADPDTCDDEITGFNLVQMIGAEDYTGFLLTDAAGRADYTIECGCALQSDCDDGEFCNGQEQCVDGHCEADPNPPCTDDGLYCNGTESCDEVADQCVHTGDPCPDDGEFCNGPESCNERNDTCEHAGNPCPDDGLYCNGEEKCDPGTSSCVSQNVPNCPDDGVFCNGDEVCDEDNDGCKSAGDPCADDGKWCNGAESCNEEGKSCETTGDPCPDDGVFCNGVEGCDEETDSCVTDDPCEDDGLFCNGEERCSETDQQCSNTGNPCSPGDYCNEETDACQDEPPNPNDDDEDAGDDADGEDQWPKGNVSGGCCGC